MSDQLKRQRAERDAARLAVAGYSRDFGQALAKRLAPEYRRRGPYYRATARNSVFCYYYPRLRGGGRGWQWWLRTPWPDLVDVRELFRLAFRFLPTETVRFRWDQELLIPYAFGLTRADVEALMVLEQLDPDPAPLVVNLALHQTTYWQALRIFNGSPVQINNLNANCPPVVTAGAGGGGP